MNIKERLLEAFYNFEERTTIALYFVLGTLFLMLLLGKSSPVFTVYVADKSVDPRKLTCIGVVYGINEKDLQPYYASDSIVSQLKNEQYRGFAIPKFDGHTVTILENGMCRFVFDDPSINKGKLKKRLWNIVLKKNERGVYGYVAEDIIEYTIDNEINY